MLPHVHGHIKIHTVPRPPAPISQRPTPLHLHKQMYAIINWNCSLMRVLAVLAGASSHAPMQARSLALILTHFAQIANLNWPH